MLVGYLMTMPMKLENKQYCMRKYLQNISKNDDINVFVNKGDLSSYTNDDNSNGVSSSSGTETDYRDCIYSFEESVVQYLCCFSVDDESSDDDNDTQYDTGHIPLAKIICLWVVYLGVFVIIEVISIVTC